VRNRTHVPPAAVHMNATVHGPNATVTHGVTDYVSSREIRFTVEEVLTARVGEYLTVFLSLPLEVTGGHQVSIRLSVKIRSVEYASFFGLNRSHLTVSVRSYDFMREEHLSDRKPCANHNLKFFTAYPS
jgi:hypothetical protein